MKSIPVKVMPTPASPPKDISRPSGGRPASDSFSSVDGEIAIARKIDNVSDNDDNDASLESNETGYGQIGMIIDLLL